MRMLNKEAYNKTGLIYGIGHAVYTISDPRAVVLKELARDLAKEKGREEEFASSNCSNHVPSSVSPSIKGRRNAFPRTLISIPVSCMK